MKTITGNVGGVLFFFVITLLSGYSQVAGQENLSFCEGQPSSDFCLGKGTFPDERWDFTKKDVSFRKKQSLKPPADLHYPLKVDAMTPLDREWTSRNL